MRRARFRRRFVHSHGAAAGRVRESSATELSPFTREGTVCIRAVVGDFANDFEKIGHRKAFVFAVKLDLKQSFVLPKREKVYLIHEFPRADAPALLFYRFKLGIGIGEGGKILAFPDHVLNLDAAYVGYPLFERVRVHGFSAAAFTGTRPPDVRYVCDIL